MGRRKPAFPLFPAGRPASFIMSSSPFSEGTRFFKDRRLGVGCGWGRPGTIALVRKPPPRRPYGAVAAAHTPRARRQEPEPNRADRAVGEEPRGGQGGSRPWAFREDDKPGGGGATAGLPGSCCRAPGDAVAEPYRTVRAAGDKPQPGPGRPLFSGGAAARWPVVSLPSCAAGRRPHRTTVPRCCRPTPASPTRKRPDAGGARLDGGSRVDYPARCLPGFARRGATRWARAGRIGHHGVAPDRASDVYVDRRGAKCG
jgi:hypothetical protein